MGTKGPEEIEMLRHRSFVVLSCCCLLASLGALPHALADDDGSGGEREVELVLPAQEEIPMGDFLQHVAGLADRQLVWNPDDKQIRGKRVQGGLHWRGTPSEIFREARALLTFYELVMVPIGPPKSHVILVMDARATTALLKLKPEVIRLSSENLSEYEHQDGLFVTTTIEVEHLDDLRNARNALQRIVTAQNIGMVVEVPEARAFVVTDFAPNVVAIYRMLQAMDVPTRVRQPGPVVIAIQHARAEDLAAVLHAHHGAQPPGPQAAAAARKSADEPAPRPGMARVTADPRTNRLLVSGDEAGIEAVRAAVKLLDTPLDRPRVRAHVVRLQWTDGAEVERALVTLTRTSPGLWTDAAAPPSVIRFEREALLVSANDRDFEVLRALIAEIDVKD